MPLTDRVAVITGGSSGIERCSAVQHPCRIMPAPGVPFGKGFGGGSYRLVLTRPGLIPRRS